MDKIMHSHIFTNKNGNTLMREFEGVLSNNPTIKNLDAVVGFLRASGYFTLRPFLDKLNSSYKCNGIHINNLFKFFVWCEVSKSFTRSII